MSLKKLASLGLIVAVFGFAACSDDTTTPPKKDTGVKTDMAKTDMAKTDMAKTDMPAAGEMGPGDAAMGACPADIQTKQWGGKGMTEIVSGQSACLLDPKPVDCLVGAVKTATNNEVTDACITCFATSALCSATTCPVCITAPTGTECIACRCGDNTGKVNCVAAFETCAGVKSTTTCP